MSMKNVFTGIDSGLDIAIEAVASKKEQRGQITRGIVEYVESSPQKWENPITRCRGRF